MKVGDLVRYIGGGQNVGRGHPGIIVDICPTLGSRWITVVFASGSRVGPMAPHGFEIVSRL